jgi:hypothetical protein
MFMLYKVTKAPPNCRFDFLRETFLFGCKKGLVARHLRILLQADAIQGDASQTYKWHFKVADALHALEPDADAFVIDLKPNEEGNASRYEVVEIAGYSHNGWTPAMLKMRALLVDKNSIEYPREAFVLSRCDELDEVMTFLYFNGNVENGALIGKWLPAGKSFTNSVLLWRDVLDYFISKL